MREDDLDGIGGECALEAATGQSMELGVGARVVSGHSNRQDFSASP